MSDRWHQFLCGALARAYYHRLSVVELTGDDSREPRGAVLYVGLHRNGAVDGLVYKRFFPRATFLISSQLTRSRFGRLFFTGIPVTRPTDRGDRTMNAESLDRCVSHLIGGGELFVLPEGTSDLGPRHLPFKPGVARILERALSSGTGVAVVPVGIFYTAADAFRSDVTVVRGPRMPTDLPPEATTPQRCDLLMARITAALEAIGINVASLEELGRIETMAALAADAPGRDYYAALKQIERATLPDDVAAAWRDVSHAIGRGELATHHGAPVLSTRGVAWNAAWFAIQSIVTAAATLANAPIVAAAWIAGRRFADARNTIALWRLLAAAPVAVGWMSFLIVVVLFTGHAPWITTYGLVTLGGLVVYPELRARWPRLRNRSLSPALRDEIAVVRSWTRSLANPLPLDAMLRREAAHVQHV
jgi:hypothetical protein